MSGAELLADLCVTTRKRLLLVAPFIKVGVLRPLLDSVQSDLPVDVVTRWWPQEIAQGVSDLEIWRDFSDLGSRRRLFLRQDLHAKYYRSDDRCLVGSANLTAKALGLRAPANFELLIEEPATSPQMMTFEEQLWTATVPVTEEIFLKMRDLVAHLPARAPVEADDVDLMLEVDFATWLPRARHPEDLYLAYTGAQELLSRSSLADCAEDLAVLSLPGGLGPEQFRFAVNAMLLSTPLISSIDRFLETERRFGEVAQYIAALTEGGDPDRKWQVVLRWFRHFAPARYHYRRPNYSELIVRANNSEARR